MYKNKDDPILSVTLHRVIMLRDKQQSNVRKARLFCVYSFKLLVLANKHFSILLMHYAPLFCFDLIFFLISCLMPFAMLNTVFASSFSRRKCQIDQVESTCVKVKKERKKGLKMCL